MKQAVPSLIQKPVLVPGFVSVIACLSHARVR
jgi:hypothetical protein